MTEKEYIVVSDRVRITTVLNILGNVINEYVPVNELAEITKKLNQWEQKLFKVIEEFR